MLVNNSNDALRSSAHPMSAHLIALNMKICQRGQCNGRMSAILIMKLVTNQNVENLTYFNKCAF